MSSLRSAIRIGAALFVVLPVLAGGCAPGDANVETGTPGSGGNSPPRGSGGAAVGATGSGGIGSAGRGVDAGGDAVAGGTDGGPLGSGGASSPGGGSGSGGVTGVGGGPSGSGGAVATGGRGGAGTAGRPGTGAINGSAGAGGPVTVFIASDSTASNYPANAANMQAGWGQMLSMYFNPMVTISNQAIGGRTSRRFSNEGRLTTILNAMKPGDYLLVQFGTNDGNTTAVYTDGEPYFVNTTDFQMFMGQYIDGARAKQGIPVLVTPPPRASCTGDSHSFGNGLLGYSNAMKTVAAAKTAALIDLNADTLAYVNMLGCVAAKADFFLLNDGTHFQQNGAHVMGGFVADGVVQLGLSLAAYRLP